ncbi:MAG: hypothetical protein WC490_05185 [Candidatus Margulisiibacteriota bacterium]
MDEDIRFFDRINAAFSYAFFFPALYIILTEKRKKEYLALHSSQALFYWVFSFVLLILVRSGTDHIMSLVYIRPFEIVLPLLMWLIWLYALWCAFLVLLGRQVNIPLVSGLAGWVA